MNRIYKMVANDVHWELNLLPHNCPIIGHSWNSHYWLKKENFKDKKMLHTHHLLFLIDYGPHKECWELCSGNGNSPSIYRVGFSVVMNRMRYPHVRAREITDCLVCIGPNDYLLVVFLLMNFNESLYSMLARNFTAPLLCRMPLGINIFGKI